MMRFDHNVTEYHVLQRGADGCATCGLGGTFLPEPPGVPYIRAISERDGTVSGECALPQTAAWQKELSLPTGLWRIESGTLLQETGGDPRYLGRGDMLKHVAAGEVFLIAGQSNAAGYGVQRREALYDLPTAGVHRFAGAWELASHPIGQLNDGPAADTLNCGHSAWLCFGNLLWHKGVPVGLVPAAKNGSSMEDWAPGGALYRNLVKLAAGTNAANLIWMQGCSDVHEGRFERYGERLEGFFEHLMKDTGILRVLLVQISGTTKQETFLGWKTVREEQRRIAARFGFLLIPSYDLGDYVDDIHLSDNSNLQLAARAARAYHGERGPRLLHACRTENGALLTFSAAFEDGIKAVLLDDGLCPLPVKGVWRGTELLLTATGRARYATLAVGVRPLDTPLEDPPADFWIDLSRPCDYAQP